MKYFTALEYNTKRTITRRFELVLKFFFFFRAVYERTFINVVTRHYSECDKTLKWKLCFENAIKSPSVVLQIIKFVFYSITDVYGHWHFKNNYVFFLRQLLWYCSVLVYYIFYLQADSSKTLKNIIKI